MGKPPTEKPSEDDFPFSPMKWDTSHESKPTQYGFIKEDNTVHPMPKRGNTPGKAIIAAVIIVLLILAYAVALILIPAYYFSRTDPSPMQIDPSLIGADTLARAEEESGSAPLVDMMQSDAGEQIAQEVLAQDSDISPPIRLIEAPLMLEQRALEQGMTP